MNGVPPAASMQAILIRGSTWQPGEAPDLRLGVAGDAVDKRVEALVRSAGAGVDEVGVDGRRRGAADLHDVVEHLRLLVVGGREAGPAVALHRLHRCLVEVDDADQPLAPAVRAVICRRDPLIDPVRQPVRRRLEPEQVELGHQIGRAGEQQAHQQRLQDAGRDFQAVRIPGRRRGLSGRAGKFGGSRMRACASRLSRDHAAFGGSTLAVERLRTPFRCPGQVEAGRSAAPRRLQRPALTRDSLAGLSLRQAING